MRTLRSTSSGEKSGSPFFMSKPQPAIHCFHGSIARSKPIPISPNAAFDVTIQYKMLGRCATYFVRSARNSTYAVAGSGQLSFDNQTCIVHDFGLCAIRAHQIARASLVHPAGAYFAERNCDAGFILVVGDVFGVERQFCPAGRRMFYEKRLHFVLREIEHRAWAALEVIAYTLFSGSPGPDSSDFWPCKTRREKCVAHPFPGSRLAPRIRLNAKIAQHFDGPLVRYVERAECWQSSYSD